MVVYERAKLYIFYCLFLLMISPIYLKLYGKRSIRLIASIGTATMIGLIIPTVIAKFRLVATETITLFTVLTRGLVLW